MLKQQSIHSQSVPPVEDKPSQESDQGFLPKLKVVCVVASVAFTGYLHPHQRSGRYRRKKDRALPVLKLLLLHKQANNTGEEPMTKTAISALRQRMLDDLALRRLTEQTQSAYIRSIERFTRFFGASPNLASPEDLRQQHPIGRHQSRCRLPITLNNNRHSHSPAPRTFEVVLSTQSYVIHPGLQPAGKRLPATSSRPPLRKLERDPHPPRSHLKYSMLPQG